ncbi:MAG TPA: response regulator [Acidobacteriaceae bacterium]|nr:response regulator [Acidobacteriaceae bacterium]
MAPAKVLLVDDDDSVLSGLGVVLQAYEFDVTTASNVTEALKLIAQMPFDVLLTDLHMPGAGDGLVVAGAMRHAHPQAVTLVLSANPDMQKATAAVLEHVDEILMKPVRATSIVDTIRQHLQGEAPRDQGSEVDPVEPLPPQSVELVARVIEHERVAITETWLSKMREAGSLAEIPLTPEELSGHLPEALNEIIYRLQYPQPLGLMTLFSMSSLQHGARRRRQGFPSPVLVEEARALQVALFQAIQNNIDRMDVTQLPGTLMAIADEVNAQLLQSLSGYENEKPVEYARD